MDTVNVQQKGTDWLSDNLCVILPRSNFSCNGRITGYMASLSSLNDDKFDECNFLRILVWHASNAEQTRYTIDSEHMYTLRKNDIQSKRNYYLAEVTLNDSIEFQSGDVIGYQYRSSPCYTVWSINISTAENISYSASAISSNMTIDINSLTADTKRQPLIKVIFGM